MKLFHRKYGNSGPPLIIVHGLYGASDNWVSIARGLEDKYEVYIIDQRNHGASPKSPEHNYEVMSEDLMEFMDEQHLEKAILVGHSMGGKTIMFFAEKYPERVASLIVVDIAPIPYHDLALTSHIAGNHAKMIDALLDLDLETLESREEASQKLATKIGSERIRMFLLKNLTRDENKHFTWKINLPVLKDNLHTIMDGLDIDTIRSKGGIIGFPVLFISGENSDYIQAETHATIKEVFPTAEIVSIRSSGHWVHAEQPMLLIKTIKYFLEN
ncbi:alpha/beta fold hydrolase [Bacteroidota bacterium]